MQYLTAKDIAEELSVSLTTAYKIIRQCSPGTSAAFDTWKIAHTVPPEVIPTFRLVPSSQGVYFVQHGDTGNIKIGCARSVQARLRGLRAMSPVPLRFLGAIPGYRREERLLHEKLHEYRLHSEWFSNTREVRAELAGLIEGLECAA